MIDRHNDELADSYGNLVDRLLTLVMKFCDGCVPDVEIEHKFDLNLLKRIDDLYKVADLYTAIELTIMQVKDLNSWITKQAPWKFLDNQRQKIITREILEIIYILTHLLLPIIPNSTNFVFEHLNHQPLSLHELQHVNLIPNTKLNCDKLILFTKIKNN